MSKNAVTRERASYVGAVIATIGLVTAVVAQFEIAGVTYEIMPPWALGLLSIWTLWYSFIYLRWYA